MLAVPAVGALSLAFFRNFQFAGRFENVFGFCFELEQKLQDIPSVGSSKILPFKLKFCDCISSSK